MTDCFSSSPAKHISKDELNALPLIFWKGRIEVLNTLEEMDAAAHILKNKSLLGFDVETRPSFKKGEYYPPALIQVGAEDCVYLFRICKTKTIAPLLPLLVSDTILKTGVAIKNDVKELKAIANFEPSGFVEVTDITRKLGYQNHGLRALAGLLLKGRISKAAQVSNWERADLSQKQILYAATDAWISRELYCRAVAERDALE
jgi:ribonuclease D